MIDIKIDGQGEDCGGDEEGEKEEEAGRAGAADGAELPGLHLRAFGLPAAEGGDGSLPAQPDSFLPDERDIAHAEPEVHPAALRAGQEHGLEDARAESPAGPLRTQRDEGHPALKEAHRRKHCSHDRLHQPPGHGLGLRSGQGLDPVPPARLKVAPV